MRTATEIQTEREATERRGSPRFAYPRAPMLIYWEITRACDLACRHCRAEALKSRSPVESSTSEGLDLLEQMRGFGRPLPHLVVTGGDPLKRGDVFDLIECAVSIGFPVSIAPSATSALSYENLRRLKAAGVDSIGLSLDGSNAQRHEGLRGVPGCFEQTLRAVRLAIDAGLRVQINTLVAAETLDDLPKIYDLLSQFSLMRWKLFNLIAVGRGKVLREIEPEQCEQLHHWLCELARRAHFAVGTTEAPHYRRVALTRMKGQGKALREILSTPAGRGFGIRDGNGIMFIAHNGEVYPSGFLPLAAGNVRSSDAVTIYRDSSLFTALRDTTNFRGRCGRCEFRDLCGGSRARAYAAHGDFLGEDPACSYQPGGNGSSDEAVV